MAQWPCGHTAGFKCAECYRERGERLDAAAVFLDALADRLDVVVRAGCVAEDEADQAAADCRAMAKRLRGET